MLRTACRVGIAVLVVLAGRHVIVTAQRFDRIQIDVVATDAHGQPVDGLTASDFQVKEDGRQVPVDSVDEAGSAGSAAERTIVILLDDTGVRPELTTRVQDIARMFVTRTSPGDRLNVVRFNRRGEEAVGDRAVALSRIADYTAGNVPFFGRETIENALARVEHLSRSFESIEDRRREIVAIGSPGVFDVREPIRGTASLIWPSYVAAIAAASRANTSVYVIDPQGVTGRVKLSGTLGLVTATGGLGFYNSAEFARAVDQIWRDAGHYYLVEYSPASSNRELHKVEVIATRPGVRARARDTRG